MTANPRSIPAVGKLLETLGDIDLPRPIVVALVRRELARVRAGTDAPRFDEIIQRIRTTTGNMQRTRLQPVINGTGIILHTNFGRAPLSAAAIRAIGEVGSSYNNLEFDLATGGRGKRGVFLESNLALLCGSEAATVVNNCAAALVLIVRHFTKNKPEVIISRGELVQIGGGFRVGDMLEASGARLREVGATNKTSLDDYASAIGSETALILKVHLSNFFMSGFVDVPPNESIAKLARSRRVPFVADLGSGALLATESLGVNEHEPTPAETLKQGADLVCFSGDKLFGGPQAGIIAGRGRLLSALKREPIFRALRCDKLAFAALEATVALHLRKEVAQIPALALLSTPNEKLRARGEALLERLRELPFQTRLVESKAEIGGGALPRSVIPSIALEFSPNHPPNEFAARLRVGNPPLIGYLANGKFKLDLRTIFPGQDDLVVRVLRECLTNKQS
jgi:L-seryl-tRNA(Ser) seleniumtransferase